MARRYFYCDYSIDDGDGKCMKPVQSAKRKGLCWCPAHLARLPYWPTGESEEAPRAEEGNQA